jgi:soluble lytic murein transglycosylase-like protein
MLGNQKYGARGNLGGEGGFINRVSDGQAAMIGRAYGQEQSPLFNRAKYAPAACLQRAVLLEFAPMLSAKKNNAFPAPVALCLCAALCVAAPAFAQQQSDAELGPLLKAALTESTDCFADRFDRDVFFTAMEPKLTRYLKDAAERKLILERVHCEALEHKLPPGLVLAVIEVESRFDRWAVSSAGAVGLMQVMPFWPKQLGMGNEQLVRIPENIRMGCTILKYYLDREKGDYTKALARYNGSVNRRNYSDKVLTSLANRWYFR